VSCVDEAVETLALPPERDVDRGTKRLGNAID
jgi:hypothetical protein